MLARIGTNGLIILLCQNGREAPVPTKNSTRTSANSKLRYGRLLFFFVCETGNTFSTLSLLPPSIISGSLGATELKGFSCCSTCSFKVLSLFENLDCPCGFRSLPHPSCDADFDLHIWAKCPVFEHIRALQVLPVDGQKLDWWG